MRTRRTPRAGHQQADGAGVAAVNHFVAEFRDPEALYYSARHLAHLNEIDAAVDLFGRVVAGGCFCFPTFARDPWVASVRKQPTFITALRQADMEPKRPRRCSGSGAARSSSGPERHAG